MSERPTSIIRTISHALAAIFVNCRRFRREWEEREERAASAPASDRGMAGLWRGEWISNATGHKGELRCIMTQLGAGRYSAFFHARYMRLLRVCYETELVGTVEDGIFRFSGEQDLGRLAGGVYRYEGEADASNFVSTYESRYDHGEFRLSRES